MTALPQNNRRGFALFGRRGTQVTVGSRYQRVRSDKTVETAHVLSLKTDALGIPHVRFSLTFRNPRRDACLREGPRVLALEAFSQTYREPVLSEIGAAAANSLVQ